MSPLVRWFRFNLVGILGMGVQLAALAAFNHLAPGHYLLATAAAIELTLLHNFFWHVRFTWPGTRDGTSQTRALLRFHLTSGVVSMTGNLVLMRLFAGLLHFPVLAANLFAIVCCSLANFALSDRWSFAPHNQAQGLASKLPFRSVGTLLLLGALALQTQAQTAPAKVPSTPYDESYFANAGIFCGLGASTSSAGSKPTGECGAGISFLPTPLFLEVGVMGPQANRSSLSGYLSVDTNVPIGHTRRKYVPFVLFGYSRLFETGHALDYGLALATPRFGKHAAPGTSFRFELRDYWTFAAPNQHNIMLRIGWMSEVSD